jgi:Ca2+-binding EF-hand superfamily protein
MWATQLVPLLVQYENKSEAFGWGLGLTLPMLGNFLIIRLVLSRAVMLQAVCGVHPQVLGEVTEEAIEEDHCLERLRRAVRHRLEADVEAVRWEALAASGTPDAELPEQTSHEKVASYKVFLKRIFDTYDDDGSGAIGEREFVTMLNDLCVYFSRSSFKILWFAIDFDLSGEVSWDELFIIMFPELKAEMKRELAIVNKLREALGNKFNEMKLTSKDERLQYMKTVFEQYDADQSGTIDVHEMEDLVREYLPEMDTKGTEQLFAAIDTDGEGGIEWSEFSDIFFGIAEQQEKKTLKWF